VKRDLFISAHSTNYYPEAFVWLALSAPAKSTRWKLLVKDSFV